MKILTLLRHAKSAWDDPRLTDFDRPLNAKGRRAARAMGKAMRDAGLTFDAVIASPAVRVTETLAEAGESYGRAFAPAWDRHIYLATPETLIDIVHGAHDGAATLLIVGHNPGLEQLALRLTPDDGAAHRAALAEKYPTGTLAEIRVPVDRWRDVAEGAGQLTRFLRPRDIDASLGPEHD